MRTSKFLAACALGSSLIAMGAAYAPAFAQDASPDNKVITVKSDQAQQGQHPHAHRMKRIHAAEQMKDVDTTGWIGLKDAYDKVEGAGYKDIHSIRRTPKGYFASAINGDGKWAILAVDPIKGQVKALERKPRKGASSQDKRPKRDAVGTKDGGPAPSE